MSRAPQDWLAVLRPLVIRNQTKIVLLVADGLGGLPIEPGGPTELEAARTPHLDRLASEGVVGLSTPVAPGLAPGSGPGHLGLFGYDPLAYEIGRGILEALGVGMHVGPGDVAVRGNFCTLDAEGRVVDRRAGRLPTEESARRVEKLRAGLRPPPGVEVEIRVGKDYRVALVLRGSGLSDEVEDTDPLREGLPPRPPRARAPEGERTAQVVAALLDQVRTLLADETQGNFLLLRGFARRPALPPFPEVTGLRAAAFALYPMYRGLAALVGMEVRDAGASLAEQLERVAAAWPDYDFFFVHHKPTDATGEDGDFAAKVAAIEALDAALPRLLALGPDVLAVTGDHSTPSRLRTHSFHPVPLLLWAPATVRPDEVDRFGERACARGGLGQLRAVDLLPLLLAHAGRLQKFGA